MTNSPIIEIDIGQLSPDPSQPRKVFDDNAISSLREDIKANGLREPIDINPLLDGRTTKYLIIDGECRFHAIEGIDDFGLVPCKLHTYKSQRQIDKHRASKHFHRKDWNPADRAEWLKYYTETHKLRQQDLAREFSVTHATISQWLAPARDERLLKALRNADIGFTQALILSRIDDAEQRKNALRESIGKTKRETEEIVNGLHFTPETPEIPQGTEEDALTVNEGEDETTEEAVEKDDDSGRKSLQPSSPETSIIDRGFEIGGEKGTEGEEEEPERETCPTCNGNAYLKQGSAQVLCPNCHGKGFTLKEKGTEEPTDSELPSDSPLIEAQSPLPEGGTVITPDIDPPTESKKKEPQVCAKVSNMEEMLQKLVKKPPKTFLATFKTTSHKGNFKNRVEGIHLWSGELVDLMESDLNGDSPFLCEIKRKRNAVMEILDRPKHSVIETERVKLDDLMDELKTKIEQDAKRGG